MRQYSPDTVNIAWLGIPDWEEGLATGVNIRETRTVPRNFRYKADGYGGAVALYDPNLTGALVITFDRESAQHAILVTLANADLASHSIVSPMLITDRSTRNVQLYNATKLAGQTAYVSGSSSSVVPWVFIFAQAVSQIFGVNHNLVGS